LFQELIVEPSAFIKMRSQGSCLFLTGAAAKLKGLSNFHEMMLQLVYESVNTLTISADLKGAIHLGPKGPSFSRVLRDKVNLSRTGLLGSIK
jgi:hypothetical protein